MIGYVTMKCEYRKNFPAHCECHENGDSRNSTGTDNPEKDVFYKKLTICTCDDDPYSNRCDWCLAKDGIMIDE